MSAYSDYSSSYPPSSNSPNTLRAFTRDGSEKHLNDTLSRLKFISKIKPNEIVDTRSMSLMEIGWFTSVYRTFVVRTEGRDATLDMFKNVIDMAFDLAELYSTSDERMYKDVGNTLIESIRQSKTGILNHSKTYDTDRMYASKTEAFIRTVDIRLDALLRKIDSSHNSSSSINIPHHNSPHHSSIYASTYPPPSTHLI
jgi:hypothetical protein